MMRCRQTLLVALTLLALLANPFPIAGQESTPDTAPVVIPATPVGDQLAWVLALLNGGAATATEADMAAHFTPAVLAELPAPALLAAFEQLATAAGPFAFQGLARPATPTRLVGFLAGRDGATFVVAVATEAAPPHRMTGAAPLPAAADAAHPAVAPESLGGRFDVGGRELFLSCSGTGSPTVVLEAGYGDSGGLWAPVQNGLAPLTRVCAYDRANVFAGGSDPAPTPRTARDLAADLHALLTAAGVPGPYVLVGHSFGGFVVRLYAADYPEEVAGLVLVDAVHEDRAARRQAMVSPAQWAAMQEFEAQFSDFERIDQGMSWSQVRAARVATPLRPMPLVVLAAGRPADPWYFPPDWPMAAEDQLHQEQLAELAALAPNGKYVLVAESGHYIHLDRPDSVIDAIGEVVAAARDPSTWATPAGPPTTAVPVATPATAGALVDIGGRRLFLSCQGTGSPTVILESGLNDGAAVWSPVQAEVAETTRVCSYDRANVPGGASDAGPGGLRPAADLVADLHSLLAAAGISGPYVLVGHSVGGLVVRLYAATYPDEVAGMVLVDATHEDYYARLQEAVGPELWAALLDQFAQAVEQGFLEPVDLEATVAQVRAGVSASPLRPMPLAVLSHSRPFDAPMAGWPVAAEDRLWGDLQDELAALVLNSRHVVVEGSGHYIQVERPDQVIDAIRRVVAAIRHPDSWETLTLGQSTNSSPRL